VIRSFSRKKHQIGARTVYRPFLGNAPHRILSSTT